MKILGICGSPRRRELSTTRHVVEAILGASGVDHELVELGRLSFSGCVACLACAPDNVCRVNDDLAPLREKILAADAYVIGSPNYYSGMTSLTHAFLERWFQFRHRGAKHLWGKVAVAVGVGSMGGEAVVEQIEKFMAYNFIKTVAKVSVAGNPCCFQCGYGHECEIGVPAMTGIPCPDPARLPTPWASPEVVASARDAGQALGDLLRGGYDRRLMAMEMQEALAERFQETV
jgi:multimeric flavodoxin WrbA